MKIAQCHGPNGKNDNVGCEGEKLIYRNSLGPNLRLYFPLSLK